MKMKSGSCRRSLLVLAPRAGVGTPLRALGESRVPARQGGRVRSVHSTPPALGNSSFALLGEGKR